MLRKINIPLMIIVAALMWLSYMFGHNFGYDSAAKTFAKVYAEKIATEENDIASDCLTKNGFIINDVTYLCQPIMPIPQYAR